MPEKAMADLREILLRQRRAVFDRVQAMRTGLDALGERDIEAEEEAQKADLTFLMEQLDERGQEEIENIDLALCRMAAGTYGICESCEAMIPSKRLEAVPAARLCVSCAENFEERKKKLTRAREAIPCTEMPADYQGLSDEEVAEAVLDRLHEDGRIDLEEVQVSSRRGMVYLEGAIPSDQEHQVLLQILTDVIGLTSFIDLLQIDEMAWEREERASGRKAATSGEEERLIYGEEEFTEDEVESAEEGLPYIVSDRPLPEKE